MLPHAGKAPATKPIMNLQAGEFQCYDERALASLASAAAAVNESEWGKEGPHDAGQYNGWPEVYLPCLRQHRGAARGTQSTYILHHESAHVEHSGPI